MTPRQRRSRRQGTAFSELILSFVVLLPMLVGGASLGINMIRTMQAQQICRDAGSMSSRFVDFSIAGNRAMLLNMAAGLGITDTGGQGVIILSEITWISDTDCTAAGYNTSTCTNRLQYIIGKRVYIGNSSLRASSYGTPNESAIDATTRQTKSANRYTDSTVRAPNFGSTLVLADEEVAYVAEVYVKGAAWAASGMAGFAGNDIYTRVVF
jgi:hypothetical protein